MVSETSVQSAPYYVKALAIGVPAFLIGIHLTTWITMLPVFLGGGADFRIFYTTGYMLRSGHRSQLYDYAAQLQFQNALVSKGDIALRFNHLAYEALLFAPLSLVSYRTAYCVFLGINIALLALSYYLLRRHFENLCAIFPWLPAALFLGFLPVAAALIQGQDSILMLVLIAVALVMFERGKEFAAGLCIGAGLFKFQIVLPIGLLFLVWRRWRFAAGFLTAAAVAAALSLLLTGFEQMKVYGNSLVSMSMARSAVDRFRYGITPNAMANLRGFIYGVTSAWISSRSMQAITAVVSALVFFYAAALGRKKLENMPILIAVITATLVSYHLLVHDLSLLLIPVVVLLNEFVVAELTGDAHGRVFFRVAALMFFSPILMSYVPQNFYLVCLPLLGLLFVLLYEPFYLDERAMEKPA